MLHFIVDDCIAAHGAGAQAAGRRRPVTLVLIALLACLGLSIAHAAPTATSPPLASSDLPILGDASSGIISPEMEQRLGAGWLRALRAGNTVLYDPLISAYIEDLAYRIASHSDLGEPRLTLLVLRHTDINAYAVPGGVIGLNAGLLLNAASEDEVASVLAHEMAHLSQRHFARGIDQKRQQRPLALTAVLASILVAATVGGDIGTAAVLGTQAGLMQSQLTYTRDNEREADRIGMHTLARAGFDPSAMPAFFERLQRDAPIDPERYPEFLRTHPITDTRISDSRNRARQLPTPGVAGNPLNFRLAQVRLQATLARDTGQAVAGFREALKQAGPGQAAPLRYGLALTLLRSNHYDEALAALAPLRAAEPERIIWRITAGELLLAAERYQEAAKILTDGLLIAPDNYPLSLYAAQVFLHQQQTEKAIALLEKQTALRPEDPQVWQLLARARGDTHDMVGVHAARAEFLFLRNQMDPAIEQLELGIAKSGGDFSRAAPLRNRVREIESVRNDFRP